MQGLLDFVKTPEGQGLLSGIFGYAANARRGQPINSLGRGGIAGLMGYDNALDRQDQQAETQFQRQYRQMQMDEMQRKIAEQKGQQEWRAGLPSILQQRTMVPNDAGPTAAPDTEAINKYLLDPRSPFADKLIEKQLFPKEEEAYTLGEGQVRYKGNQVVAQGPEKPVDPNKPFLVIDGKIVANPDYQAFELERASRSAARNSTTVVNKQETEEAKTVGGFFGNSYADIQKAGMNAGSKLNRYDRLGSLLDGVGTGRLTPLGMEIAKTAESLGIKIDPNLPNKEAAQALSSEIALELRNPSGGAGMPGAMSDSDRQFLVSMVPGLSTTPEGRKLMLDTASKLAKRDQEVATLARQYRQRHGSIDEGFYNELGKWSAQNPLFKQKSIMRQNPPTPAVQGGARFLGFE